MRRGQYRKRISNKLWYSSPVMRYFISYRQIWGEIKSRYEPLIHLNTTKRSLMWIALINVKPYQRFWSYFHGYYKIIEWPLKLLIPLFNLLLLGLLILVHLILNGLMLIFEFIFFSSFWKFLFIIILVIILLLTLFFIYF